MWFCPELHFVSFLFVFQVLQIDPEATDEELKKRFRQVRLVPCLDFWSRVYWFLIFCVFKTTFFNRFLQLSILVHPDKNQEDADRAQLAFEGESLYKKWIDLLKAKVAEGACTSGWGRNAWSSVMLYVRNGRTSKHLNSSARFCLLPVLLSGMVLKCF